MRPELALEVARHPARRRPEHRPLPLGCNISATFSPLRSDARYAEAMVKSAERTAPARARRITPLKRSPVSLPRILD
jgi:hypothetical protein